MVCGRVDVLSDRTAATPVEPAVADGAAGEVFESLAKWDCPAQRRTSEQENQTREPEVGDASSASFSSAVSRLSAVQRNAGRGRRRQQLGTAEEDLLQPTRLRLQTGKPPPTK